MRAARWLAWAVAVVSYAESSLRGLPGRFRNSDPLSYNATIASLALDLANVAYCEKDSMLDWSCVPCQRLVRAGVTIPAGEHLQVFDGVVGGFGPVQQWGPPFLKLRFPSSAQKCSNYASWQGHGRSLVCFPVSGSSSPSVARQI